MAAAPGGRCKGNDMSNHNTQISANAPSGYKVYCTCGWSAAYPNWSDARNGEANHRATAPSGPYFPSAGR